MELPFTPMLLERSRAAFADDQWTYQVKWDGVRNLCLVDAGQVKHWSRRLRERTRQFPEFNGLSEACNGRRAVLDGEIVVLRNGRPSFSAILERDLTGNAPDSRKLDLTPATFMVFDLLELDQRPLYSVPLEERLGLLEQVVIPATNWQTVQSFPGRVGPDLFRAAVRAGLEGVVAKRLDSRYAPGERSRNWIKIKRRERLLALVCGYTMTSGRPSGLVLGGYRAGRLVYIGRAGPGLTAAELTLLRTHLVPAARPLDYQPTFRDRFSGPPGQIVWTDPILTVEIEFTEWTEDGKLRDPVVIGFTGQSPDTAVLDLPEGGLNLDGGEPAARSNHPR